MGAKTPLLKRPWEAKGLACLTGAVVLALCLLSFHPDDPSFTRFVAGDIKTHNLIGTFGSHTADLLIRLLGPASLFLPAGLFFCAFRYFRSPSFRSAVSPWGASFCSSCPSPVC
jgi:S-DNA-T family DNA segregation ATPase FtsK/SpoIIIE